MYAYVYTHMCVCTCTHTHMCACACAHTHAELHACAHTVCGNGNTVAKIDYLTLTMHIFAAVRLVFWFYVFIVMYKFFLHHASLRFEKISEHIFLPDNAMLETYTVQEQCRNTICKTVDFI